MNKPISLSITKTVLKDIISESDTKITVEMIKKIVCKHYEITASAAGEGEGAIRAHRVCVTDRDRKSVV